MGISSDGLLVYGCDLGSIVNELYWSDDDPDTPEWYDREEIYNNGFEDPAIKYLLEKTGLFTETDWESEGYWKRKNEAEAKLGINFVYHCSYDYAMLILTASAAPSYRAWRGEPISIDPVELQGNTEE